MADAIEKHTFKDIAAIPNVWVVQVMHHCAVSSESGENAFSPGCVTKPHCVCRLRDWHHAGVSLCVR
jgi:hypothetical protein